MISFKHLFAPLFLMLYGVTAVCQTIEFYDISISVANPPGWGHHSEWYLKDDGRAVHKVIQHDYDLKHTTTEKTFREELTENQLTLFDSLFRLEEFKFKVSKQVIAAIKKDAHWYGISHADIARFLEKGDSVTLRIKDIPKDSDRIFTVDGAPFSINYKVKRTGLDTLHYLAEGNFAATNISNDEIPNWLSVYLFNKRNKLFTSVKSMDVYYSDKRLKDVLLRCIRWEKM
jgi:hypothetical protein